MRKIAVVTGTRAEYGLLRPVMEEIRRHPRLRLAVVVTGMHLRRQHGMTVNEITGDGFEVDERVKMAPADDSGAAMADAVGKGIHGMTKSFKGIGPDFVLVLGDRIEALAAVVAAAYMNIPIAHVHGGDSARAGLDESVRHSVTKFAHVHFAATEKSGQRILRMGEDDWRIHVVGAPGLDSILNTRLPTRRKLQQELGLDLEAPYALMVQHSVTTEPGLAGRQARETLEALKRSRFEVLVIYPNYDAGGRQIIKIISEYARFPRFHAFKNLEHTVYLSLMKHAAVMVGNSSSGIIESSSFKLPVVNIGMRQEGRERSANVIDVSHERTKILKAIKKATSRSFAEIVLRAKNPYGDGKAGKRIARILARVAINKKLIQKKLAY